MQSCEVVFLAFKSRNILHTDETGKDINPGNVSVRPSIKNSPPRVDPPIIRPSNIYQTVHCTRTCSIVDHSHASHPNPGVSAYNPSWMCNTALSSPETLFHSRIAACQLVSFGSCRRRCEDRPAYLPYLTYQFYAINITWQKSHAATR